MGRWACWAGRLAGSWFRRRPAAFSIDLDNLYRIEAHLALTFARLGTVHFPPPLLRHLRTCLDPRSYLRVWWRSRRSVASTTVHLIEADAPLPASGRSIRVGDDYYGPTVAEDVAYYPYVMHPWVYALGRHRRVATLRRTTPRRFRIFFAGVVNDGYGDRFDFPILSRPAILEFILETFHADACVITSRAELPALRRTDRPILLILRRGDVTPTASNHFLPRATYFRMLARSEFALCPPGVFMPHAHNLVEALAVGTVPLTNYPHFCHPPLIPGQTCLAFSTPATLGATIRQALNLPLDQIAPLRAAATAYYDTHLSPAATARNLACFLDHSGSNPRLLINREFPAARLWSRSKPPTL